MTYKTVLGPKQIIDGADRSKENLTADFENIINRYAAEGWSYHSMEVVPVKEGKSALSQYVNYQMLIFVKQ